MNESTNSRRLGYSSVIPPRMGTNVPRVGNEVLSRFSVGNLSDISDAVGRLYTMDPGIKPLYVPNHRMIGQALTVKAVPGDNFAIHGALSLTQPGDVLVVDWLGYDEGCGGGGMACKVPVSKGLSGIVIDGMWRDIGEVAALDLPIFGRGVSPFSPLKSQLGEINVPVCCGGIIVEPGDIIIGEGDGVVVVPRRDVETVADVLRGHDVGTVAGTLATIYRERFSERSGVMVDHSEW